MSQVNTSSGVAAVRVRMESPDALFAPDHRIQTPVPGPLHLLSCIRLPLETAYAISEEGVVENPAHAFQRNVVTYPDGSRFEAQVSGSPALGLPNIYDLDYLLGLASLADQGAVSEDGRFLDTSYRSILLATRPGSDPSGVGGEKYAAVKRALGRWANTSVRTHLEMAMEPHAERVRTGAGVALTPAGSPKRREREATHWILEYDVEREQAVDTIHQLRINPVWLGQTEAGVAAWIDLEAHNALRSAIAKGIYLRLVIGVAQGWRPGRDSHLLSRWLEILGAQTSERPADIAARFRKALGELQRADIVADFGVASIKRGVYQVDILPGDRVLNAAAARGIGSLDPVRTRVLIAHLGQYQISAGEARALLARYGMRVQDVLQRVAYTRSVKKGLDAKGQPIVAWHSWIGAALAGEWQFHEPEYRRWLEAKETSYVAELPDPPAPAPLNRDLLGAVTPEPAAPAAPELLLPDNVWGRALEQIRPEIPPMQFATWFRETELQEVATDGTVRIATPNSFAAQWIQDKQGPRLRAVLTELLGRPVRLEIVRSPPSAPSE